MAFRILGDGTVTSSVNIGSTLTFDMPVAYPGQDVFGDIQFNNFTFETDSGNVQTYEMGRRRRRFRIGLTNLTTEQVEGLKTFFRAVENLHWFTLQPPLMPLQQTLSQEYASSTTILQATLFANQLDDFWIDTVAFIINAGSAAYGQARKVIDSNQSPGQVICEAFANAVTSSIPDTFILGFKVRLEQNPLEVPNYKIGNWRECVLNLIEVVVE